MTKKFFIGIMLMVCSLNIVSSQNIIEMPIKKTVNHSALFGVGTMSLTDTYLSPLSYNGTSLSLFYDRLSATSLCNSKLLLQQQFLFQGASTKSPSNNSFTYYGTFNYHIHGFYPILKSNSFRLLGGAGADFSLGGVHNIRNSNNPAQLKTAINLNTSLLLFYNWKMLMFRWQLTTPLMGAFFSPAYKQSYYEIFVIGNDDDVLHFATPFNQRGLRNYITVDYSLGKMSLRAGYLGNYYRTEVNNLVTSISSHQFVFGLVFESLNFSRQDIKNNDWLKSVYND